MTKTISDRIQSVVTEACQGQKLRILPILGPSAGESAYELLRPQTLDRVKVTEVSEAGNVPELQVENALDLPVFLMDGQELVGAKQNRILNTDVLVPARATLRIPVSCVEQHRWRHVSPAFSSSGHSASHRPRSAKLARVHASLKASGSHDADQGAVWQEVKQSLAASGATSSTGALHDAYASRAEALAAFRKDLRLPERAVGVAVFHGGRLQGLDLFDRHETLRHYWECLIDSYAIDLMDAPEETTAAGAEVDDEVRKVRSILDRVAAAENWERFASIGEGTEWRTLNEDLVAASLVWNERVMHLQVYPKSAGGS